MSVVETMYVYDAYLLITQIYVDIREVYSQLLDDLLK